MADHCAVINFQRAIGIGVEAEFQTRRMETECQIGFTARQRVHREHPRFEVRARHHPRGLGFGCAEFPSRFLRQWLCETDGNQLGFQPYDVRQFDELGRS